MCKNFHNTCSMIGIDRDYTTSGDTLAFEGIAFTIAAGFFPTCLDFRYTRRHNSYAV